MSNIVEVNLSEPVDPSCKPTISISVTARSFETAARVARSVPQADEAIAVVITNHATKEDVDGREIEQLNSLLLADKPSTVLHISPSSHPDLFIPDVPDTYRVGHPLAGEEHPGPHDGRPLLRDWSEVRNLGLAMCSQEWRLVMTGNEVLAGPESLPKICAELNLHRRDVAYSPLRSGGGHVVHSARLTRNLPTMRWEGTARETLEGGTRPAVLDGPLRVRKTSTDDDEVFSILYAEARARDWDVAPTNLIHLARSAWRVHGERMTDFCQAAIDMYLDQSLYPEERAWACAVMGEIRETQKRTKLALRWYERSVEEFPCWKSYYRLTRAHFREQRWQDCLDAYDKGLELADQVPLVDDGAETSKATLVHAACALHQLGRFTEASRAAETLRKLFPLSNTVTQLTSIIGAP